MNILEKAITQKHLTEETVDAQFCSDWLKDEIKLIMEESSRYKAALELIAAPKRPDGTYNRCREACEQLAKEALKAKEPNET